MGLFNSDITRGTSSSSSKMDNLTPEMPSKYLLLPTWVFILLAIFFPPAVILLVKPKLSLELILVILLTLIGWLPGTLYALYVVFRAKKIVEQGLKVNTDNILSQTCQQCIVVEVMWKCNVIGYDQSRYKFPNRFLRKQKKKKKKKKKVFCVKTLL